MEDALANLGDAKVIPGEVVFRSSMTLTASLADLTADVVRERGSASTKGFKAEMEKQRPARKRASSFGVNYNDVLKLVRDPFTGYKQLSPEHGGRYLQGWCRGQWPHRW